MSGNSTGAPTVPDQADGIAIATLYLVVMMVVSVLIRLAFRFYMLRSLRWDDGTVSLSLVFAIVQSGVIYAGTKQGLGKPQTILSVDQVSAVEKDIYVSNLFYVLALGLAKISVLQFLSKICVNKLHKRICFWSSVLIIAWIISAFFTLAFQCGVPNPWMIDSAHCISIFDFWAAISPFDILTEFIICVLPIYIVKPVQVVFAKKMTVVGAFVFRFFLIITTIVRLVYMKSATPSADIGLYSFETTILTQCNLCVSLMTACIPCLKPFLDAFDSGMLKVSMLKHATGSHSNSYGNSYALGSMGRGVKESATRTRYMEDEQELGTAAAAFAVTTPGRPLGGNNPLTIHRTDEWTVQSETGKTPSIDENVASSDGSGRRHAPHAL